MIEEKRKNWREFCRAALNAEDPNELLQIVQDLMKVLKGEEQVLRDFRDAMRSANRAKRAWTSSAPKMRL